jgi:hypothetical protein
MKLRMTGYNIEQPGMHTIYPKCSPKQKSFNGLFEI